MAVVSLNNRIPDGAAKVLDRGYVHLVDVMGSDLSIVNAARVSFLKESNKMSDNDEKIIKFLAREGHYSPFRHVFATFEINAPLEVARQWWKYVVGSDHTMDSWNEASRRYVTIDPEFYVPDGDKWRRAPEDKKQGSGSCFDGGFGNSWTEKLREFSEHSKSLYTSAMEAGICAEQARLFLTAYNMYTTWRWSASLQSISHFILQRHPKYSHGAQVEIQEYAKAVESLIIDKFPVSIKALLNKDDK
jgi:thymidylate synthase (FAD)